MNMNNRNKKIIQTSIIGILGNLLLVTIKAILGFIMNSIAIILDAVNNLSDALSSVITIIGTKLAGKKANKKHPLGYGRIEYLTTSLIAFIVLYAGVTAMIDSIKSIINPEETNYSIVGIVIIAVAVLIKVALGLFFRKRGKKYNSDSLTASGTDALFDAIISLSTVLTAVIYLIFKINLEAYLGIIISIFILKSGIEILLETLSNLLGKRPEKELCDAIKELALSFDGVYGVYDLFIHNYGPDSYYVSFHVEVEDDLSSSKIDEMTRMITEKIYANMHIIVTSIGVYAVNLHDEETKNLYLNIKEEVEKFEYVESFHGFHFNKENKVVTFDIVISFDCPNIKEEYNHILQVIQEKFSDYKIIIIRDIDISD